MQHVGKDYPYFWPPDASQQAVPDQFNRLCRRLWVLLDGPNGFLIGGWEGEFFTELGDFDRNLKQIRYRVNNPPNTNPNDELLLINQINEDEFFFRWYWTFFSADSGISCSTQANRFVTTINRSVVGDNWDDQPGMPLFNGWQFATSFQISWAQSATLDPDYHPYRV